MRLSNLITPGDGAILSGDDRQILGVTADSRQVKSDFLFAAIPGTQQDGRAYILDAITRGALAILAPIGTKQSDFPGHVAFVTVPDVRVALSLIASRFYPRQPQTIAAVTGTSGKTSTVQFTRELWMHAGHASASIGTLGVIGPDLHRYGSLTTPDPVTLHQAIDEVAGKGITHLAMEASSHGIELHRLDHVHIKLAAFTNLSRDHLDYHETMENYFAAKRRLFSTLLRADGLAILNADSDMYDLLQADCAERKIKTLSFGRKGKHLKLTTCTPDAEGQRLSFELMGKPYDILLPVMGAFQAENSLCALALTIGSGESNDKMVEAMTKLSGVPGRLEKIGMTTSGGVVFVDYAHKPAALENVLAALRPHVEATPGARLHVVFGCGGNRDTGKRPLMGGIAMRLADRVIITDDNPRKEDAATIRRDILAGCQGDANLREIGDRAAAIAAGIEDLKAGDVLVIAGKGHEEGQIVGDTILPFSDADVARQILNKSA